jgi:hypothetical protein
MRWKAAPAVVSAERVSRRTWAGRTWKDEREKMKEKRRRVGGGGQEVQYVGGEWRNDSYLSKLIGFVTGGRLFLRFILKIE